MQKQTFGHRSEILFLVDLLICGADLRLIASVQECEFSELVLNINVDKGR